LQQAEQAGFWKLVSRVFVENITSRTLLRSLGFREVGVYEKHAQLDGVWRDVVIVLTGNLRKASNKNKRE
jgi:L-amino acid N-acyltransferase YncA